MLHEKLGDVCVTLPRCSMKRSSSICIQVVDLSIRLQKQLHNLDVIGFASIIKSAASDFVDSIQISGARSGARSYQKLHHVRAALRRLPDQRSLPSRIQHIKITTAVADKRFR